VIGGAKNEKGRSAVNASERSQYPAEAFDALAEIEASHWWFVWRNRIIISALQRAQPDIGSFLEVGCGTGFVLQAIRRAWPNARLETAELHLEGISHARRRVPTANFRQLDVRFMDEPAAFDAIGAFDVIEHIEEHELVVRNLARALKPGGVLAVTVPQHPGLWSATDEHACHVRRYTRPLLRDTMQQAGLVVEHATSFVSLLLPLMWLNRRRPAPKDADPMSEFRIHPAVNAALGSVMAAEFAMLSGGLSLPAGGSLLMIARKPG
jgi:SAM-dependent methyltransferase